MPVLVVLESDMQYQRNIELELQSRKQSNTNFLLLTLLFSVIPFLHLGITYYLSAQLLGIAALLLLVLRMGVNGRAFQFVALGCILFIAKGLAEVFTPDIHELLLVSREMFCFALLVLAIQQIAYLSRPDVLLRQYGIFLNVSLALVCIQFLAILNGWFIQFPIDWFIMNDETLRGVDLALEYGTRLRPVGFYGEPSYMAFIMVSALVVFLFLETRLRRVIRVLLLNLFAFVLLGSLSGALAFFVIVTVYFLQKRSPGTRYKLLPRLTLLGLAIGVAALILLFQSDFSGRISSLFSEENVDPSIYVRYVVPVLMLSTMLMDGQLAGYSGNEIISMVQEYGSGSVDNALLYLMLHYGAIGPLFMVVLAYYVRHPLLIVYFLMVLNFNGAFFSFDKVVVMALVIGLSLGLFKKSQKAGIS